MKVEAPSYNELKLKVAALKQEIAQLKEQLRKNNPNTSRSNEKKLSTIIENFPDGSISLIDSNHIIQITGGTDYKKFNINASVFKQTHINKALTPEMAKINEPHINKAFQGESSKFLVEYKGVFYQNYTYPIITNAQKIDYVLLISQNVTQQKLTEKKLTEAKEKAEEGIRLKNSFLANISHEIRTPMNSIIGFTDMLNKPNLTETKRKKYTQIITQSSQELLDIINSVIDISKIETGQVEITKYAFSVNNLILELFNANKKEAEATKIELLYHVDLSEVESLIYSDALKLRKVLKHLINNAFKFTQKGQIKFGYRKKEKDLKFFVKDTGIGIDKELQNKIFETFRQGEIGDTRKYGGIGLGLSICKSFVELLGGEIGLESELKNGTTVFFTIPYTPVKTNKQITPPQQNKNSELTILVAEDDEINYYFIEEALDDFNFKLIHVRTGIEAIEICQNETIEINLILMDIKMPGLNGYLATKEIKKIRPELPIIAQTAYALKNDKIKILQAGCDDYLTKPINKNELIKKVKNALALN